MAKKQIFNDYHRFTKWPCAQKIIVLRSVFSVLLCFSVKQFVGQERTATYANTLESLRPRTLRMVAFGGTPVNWTTGKWGGLNRIDPLKYQYPKNHAVRGTTIPYPWRVSLRGGTTDVTPSLQRVCIGSTPLNTVTNNDGIPLFLLLRSCFNGRLTVVGRSSRFAIFLGRCLACN